MKTVSFIGSDKNAGKTTALTFFYQQLCQLRDPGSICLGSIGINGEDVDTYEHRKKPSIKVQKGSCFVSSVEHLANITGWYDVLHCFDGPEFSKSYLLARALLTCDLVLEGPNERNALLKMKKEISGREDIDTILLDGSIDRQFIGTPEVSDEICFALLLSERKEQLQKARALIETLKLPLCNSEWQKRIGEQREHETRSIYFGKEKTALYHSKEIPFLDDSLKQICLDQSREEGVLYLNGALTKTLYRFLSPFKNLVVILDNFTCYQNISTELSREKRFKPRLEVLEKVPVKSLFVKQDRWESSFRLPAEIPAINLFRDDLDEIRI